MSEHEKSLEEMADALTASGKYQVIPKDTSHRIKCWVCGQWQAERFTRAVNFNGIDESVCLQCRSLIQEREADLARYEEAEDE